METLAATFVAWLRSWWQWQWPQRRPKPLLILDMNKVLVARAFKPTLDDGSEHREMAPYLASARLLGQHYTWLRPGVDEFIEYVFENFTVALWSSAKQQNVNLLAAYVFGFRRRDMLFEWDQTHCTAVTPHPDGVTPWPLYRKDLETVWRDFPQFDASNTLIVDDSPQKMAANDARRNVVLVEPWSPADYHSTTCADVRRQIGAALALINMN